MLKVYDQNKKFIKNISAYKDLCIESELETGERTLSFQYCRKKTWLQNEYYIETEKDWYVVKEIEKGSGINPKITCQLNLEELESCTYDSFTAEKVTLTDAARLALTGTGWLVETDIEKQRSVAAIRATPLEILQKIRDAWMCEISFDTKRQCVKFSEKIGENKGVYFLPSLNLRSVSGTQETYDFCTRLIPVGKDGLKISDVNDGKEYIENHQYSEKIKTLVWEDSSYEDAETLKEDAERKLEDLSKPKMSYTADVIDIAKQSKKYSILAYGLGDEIFFADEKSGIKDRQRIVKLIEYPQNPEKNSCELSNTTLTFEEYQAKLEAAANAFETISNKDGTVNGVYVRGVEADGIVGIETVIGNSPSVKKLGSSVSGLQDSVGTIDGRVGAIESTYINGTVIEGKYAYFDFSKIKDVEIDRAMIKKGAIGTAQIQEGSIVDALIANLDAGKIKTGTLETERLIIRGSNKSIVYELNNITGALQAQNVDTLNGEVITPRTITAERIATKSLTAEEINVIDIFAQKILATGTITGLELIGATGTIGCWKMDADHMYDENSGAGINRNGRGMAFWAGGGGITGETAPFRVDHAGEAWFENAHVKGNVEATSFTAEAAIRVKPVGANAGKLFSTGESIDAPNAVFVDIDNIFSEMYFCCDVHLQKEVEVAGGLTCDSTIYAAGNIETSGGVYTDDWFRSRGDTGWYSQNHGGGIHMYDDTWIRTFGSKNFYCDQTVRAGKGMQSDGFDDGGAQFRAVYGNYGVMLRNDGNAAYILITNDGDQYGQWRSTWPFIIDLASGSVTMSEGQELKGGTYIYSSSGNKRMIFNSNDRLIPTAASGASSANTVDLGSGENYYKSLYYGTALTKKSDRRDKDEIGNLTGEKSLKILRGLQAKEFTYKNDAEKVVQFGAYAQDVRDMLEKTGIGHTALIDISVRGTEQETKELDYDENLVTYGLDYTQLIMPLVVGWQSHDEEIQELKRENAEMKMKIEFLENQTKTA